MRMTLAQNLAAAVADIKQFKHGPIDTQSYLEWCDKYQAQLIVLAAQISWSEEVNLSRHFFNTFFELGQDAVHAFFKQ